MRAGLIDDFIRNILSVPFCPYHFVRYHFVLEPLEGVNCNYSPLRILTSASIIPRLPPIVQIKI